MPFSYRYGIPDGILWWCASVIPHEWRCPGLAASRPTACKRGRWETLGNNSSLTAVRKECRYTERTRWIASLHFNVNIYPIDSYKQTLTAVRKECRHTERTRWIASLQFKGSIYPTDSCKLTLTAVRGQDRPFFSHFPKMESVQRSLPTFSVPFPYDGKGTKRSSRR